MRTLVRLAGLLRFEDLLMALLAVILLPALDRWPGGGSAAGSSSDPTVVAGLLGLVAVGGVVACVLTRGPDEPSPLADGRMTLQGWARFPLAAGVGIVATETIPGLGFDPQLLVGFAFVATFIGALAHPRLPVVPVAYRRAMVLPMAILAAAAFDRIVGNGLGEVIVDFVGGAVSARGGRALAVGAGRCRDHVRHAGRRAARDRRPRGERIRLGGPVRVPRRQRGARDDPRDPLTRPDRSRAQRRRRG